MTEYPNKKIEHATRLYLEGIRDGDARRAVETFTGDRYTQHSTGVRDGVEGFVEFFEPFVERNPERHIDIVRSWSDGRYVFLQAYQEIGEARWVTTDFFDTDEDEKIIEHWDVIAALSAPNPSGRTQVDGPTEVTDRAHTEANKALVRDMLENVLMTGAVCDDLTTYFAEPYLQHNPDVGDGLEHFGALVQDADRALNYDEIVLLVGEGNFVATLCKANWQGAPLAQVDIFRVHDGRIVEHWDNSEPVPENDVNGGKF
ncbi:MAG: nuclear transport factor 2 family protein [Actinomycetota bacterium]